MRKVFLLTALALAPLHAEGAPAAIDLLWGVRIPMRDGIRLNANRLQGQSDARAAHIALHHDTAHASFLQLPIVVRAPSR